MNSIQATQSPSVIIAHLDEARHALASAQNAFERVRVRDHAKTLQSAAEILNRRDIQVQASILVQQAERTIAKANPPKKRGPKPNDNFVLPEDETLPGSTLRNIR